MQITFNKLMELTGLGKNACRVYMDSWRLSKYLTTKFAKRGKYKRKIFAIKFNQNFINDFAEFMKLKQHENRLFKYKAEELLKGHKCY